MRLRWLGVTLIIWAMLASVDAFAQDVDVLRAGVVKISSLAEGKHKTGAGFIVKLEPGIAYIVTAAHVVEGDPAPQVEFFTRRNVTVKGEIRKIEGNNPEGLALMVVRGRDNLPAGLAALKLGALVSLKPGTDQVSAIGFPSGVVSWGVQRLNVVSLEGRYIVLSKDLEEGNSGGPVIKDNQVVGLVMGLNQGFGLALSVSIVQTVLTNWGVGSSVEPISEPVDETKVKGKSDESKPQSSSALALNTGRLEFGEQEVCVMQDKSIQLINRSRDSMRITRITLDEPRAFSVQGCVNQSIPPGESCTINVKFLPKSKSEFQGLLTILNSVDSQPQFIATAGIGAAAGVCCWYGYIYPMNKDRCKNIRGYFGVNELGFQCVKPKIQPYPVRPDCPPEK